MKIRKHKFVFGVFNSGKIVFMINRLTCSHNVAALIIGILNLGEHCLSTGDYFACDYESEEKRWKS